LRISLKLLGGSYLVRATTDHEHDHGGFPEHETRARLFAFFPLSVLIIHPCFNAPASQQILVIPLSFAIPQTNKRSFWLFEILKHKKFDKTRPHPFAAN
jgi:hypothetical protein